MSDEKSPCGLYRPGHQTDWIQMKKSHEDDQPITPVKVVAVQDDGRVDIDSTDGKLTLWFHESRRMRLVVGQYARWKPKYHVLETSSHGSFNMATLDEHESCIPPIRRQPQETVRQYIERAMRDYGGYTVPQRWLADLDAIPDEDTGEPQSGYLVPVAEHQRTALDNAMLDRLRSLNPAPESGEDDRS
jgi:hypothetical protein